MTTDTTDNKIPLIALIGLPNSGKSTLINRITGEKKAITDKIAHTTRDLLYGEDIWNGLKMKFVDTGGLVPDPEDKIQKLIQIKSWQAIAEADLLLWIIDRKQNIDKITEPTIQKIWSSKKPFFVVINKVDDPNTEKPVEDYAHLGGDFFINVSATSGYGLGDLMDNIVIKLHEMGFENQQNLENTLDEAEEINSKPKKGKRTKVVLQNEDGTYSVVYDDNFEGGKNYQETVVSAHESVILKKRDWSKKPIKLVFLGRPNVGKSSLFNSMVGKEIQIVTEIPGTTLSVNDYLLERPESENKYILLDTAGIRKAGQRKLGVETFATYRTVQAVNESDVVLLVYDASVPLTHQDQVVSGIANESKKGLVVVFNKSDLIDGSQKERFFAKFKHKFQFLKIDEVVWVSALEGRNLHKIWDAVDRVIESRSKEIDPVELRKLFNYLMKQKKPQKMTDRKKPVVYDLVFTKQSPPTFELWVRYADTIHWSYVRFLANTLKKQFEFEGGSVIVKVVEKKRMNLNNTKSQFNK